MKASNVWPPARPEKPNPEIPPLKARRRSEISSSISRMGQMFCKGAASEDTEATGLESDSVCPPSHSRRQSRSNSDRVPLQATTLENQMSLRSTGPTPPANVGEYLADAVVSFLPSYLEADKAACWSCLEGNSKSVRLMPPPASPPDLTSNPVIEALGVTPKSKIRPSKYNVSGTMNLPGNAIPTPAKPHRKQFSPAFGGVPESGPAPLSSLKEGPIDTSTACTIGTTSDDDDAFLPDGFVNENDSQGVSLLYTEAELNRKIQEALFNQENVLATNTAASEDSSKLKELEAQMQEQLEEQSAQWNRDLEERLATARAHHNKKKASMKARISELEQQCRELELYKEKENSARLLLLEQHQCETDCIQQSSQAERKTLLQELSDKNEKLLKLHEEASKYSQQTIDCTPGFIRELQNTISELRNEKKLFQSREAALLQKVQGLEGNTSHLESVVSVLQESQKLEQKKMSYLQDTVVTLGRDKLVHKADNLQLQSKLSDCETNVSTVESEFNQAMSQEKAAEQELEEKSRHFNDLKASFQRCLDLIVEKVKNVAPGQEEESEPNNETTSIEEHQWSATVEANIVRHMDTLCSLVNEKEKVALKAQEDVANLEAQNSVLEKDERERVEALQTIQQLNEQLALKTNEIAESEAAAAEELVVLQEQLEKSRTRVSELLGTISRKEQDSMKLLQDLQASKVQISVFESQLRDLRGQDLGNEESLELLESLRARLQERVDEGASLKKEKNELEIQIAGLKDQLEVFQGMIEEKDAKLVCLGQDSSRSAEARRILTEKIDWIVAHVDKTEQQYNLVKDDASVTSRSDVQKLEKVEHHLAHTICDFFEGKITELEHSLLLHKQKSEQSKHDLQAKVNALERELAETRQEKATLTSEIAHLRRTILSSKEASVDAKKKHQEVFQDLSVTKEKLEVLKTEKMTLEQTLSSLEAYSQVFKEEKVREVEAMTQEYQEMLANAREECERLQSEVSGAKETELELNNRLAEIESHLEASRSDCARLDSLLELRSGNIEELLKCTVELEKKSKETVEKCEAQLRQARESNRDELDEIMLALSDLEEEQKERNAQNETLLKEKDAIVAALGSQLAETQKRIILLEDSLAESTNALKRAEEDAIRAKIGADSSQDELAKMKESHSRTLASEQQKSAKAIEAAREETIQEAEEQFKAANDVYRKVVQDFKAEQKKVAELSDNLATVKFDLEKAKKLHASEIAELNDHVAELESRQAQAHASAAREVKKHLDELEKLRAVEKDLQERISQSELFSRSLQKLLASVVADKERLTAENEELQKVCEETLSLYESKSSSSSS